jgi:predicted transcriptional regulator
MPGSFRLGRIADTDISVHLSDIRRVARGEWEQTPVGFAMIPLEKLHAVSPRHSLNEVLPLMVTQDVNQLPVVQYTFVLLARGKENMHGHWSTGVCGDRL